MRGFKLVPWWFSTHDIRICKLFLLYRCFLILEIRHDMSEKFMTIMLINRGKLIYNFSLNIIWGDYNNHLCCLFPTTPHLLIQLLIIFLKPHILIEFSKAHWQSKIIFHSTNFLKSSILFIQEMHFQLINC